MGSTAGFPRVHLARIGIAFAATKSQLVMLRLVFAIKKVLAEQPLVDLISSVSANNVLFFVQIDLNHPV